MRAHPPSHPPRAVRGLAGAALTVAVAGIATTTAFAADAANIETAPSPVRPGSTVTLSTEACGPGGSAGVDASSLGGGILGLEPKKADSGTALGTLRIPADVKPGNYAIGGSCTDGRELTGTVVVGDEKRMAEQKPQDRAAEREPHHGKGYAPEHEARDREAQDHETQDHETRDHEAHAPDGRAEAPHHEQDAGHRADHHPRDDRHGAMPHGRVHTGLGGGTDGMSTGQLAGGSVALTAAAGGVLYLRRRHRVLGS